MRERIKSFGLSVILWSQDNEITWNAGWRIVAYVVVYVITSTLIKAF